MSTLLFLGSVFFLFLSASAALAIVRVLRRAPGRFPERRAALLLAGVFVLSAVTALVGAALSGARPATVPVAAVLYAGARVTLEMLSRREGHQPLPPQLRARLRRSSVVLLAAVAVELALAAPVGVVLGWPWAVGLVVLALLALPTALRQRARASA